MSGALDLVFFFNLSRTVGVRSNELERSRLFRRAGLEVTSRPAELALLLRDKQRATVSGVDPEALQLLAPDNSGATVFGQQALQPHVSASHAVSQQNGTFPTCRGRVKESGAHDLCKQKPLGFLNPVVHAQLAMLSMHCLIPITIVLNTIGWALLQSLGRSA